jgi:hypothetical protein
LVEAIRTSQAQATSKPPVIATPLIAPTTGLRQISIALTGFFGGAFRIGGAKRTRLRAKLLEIEPGGEWHAYPRP